MGSTMWSGQVRREESSRTRPRRRGGHGRRRDEMMESYFVGYFKFPHYNSASTIAESDSVTGVLPLTLPS